VLDAVLQEDIVRQGKQAEFVYAEAPEQAFALMRDGKDGVIGRPSCG